MLVYGCEEEGVRPWLKEPNTRILIRTQELELNKCCIVCEKGYHKMTIFHYNFCLKTEGRLPKSIVPTVVV